MKEWIRAGRLSSAPACLGPADPTPLRLSGISVIIVRPARACSSAGRGGGDFADTLKECVRAAGHQNYGLCGVIANVLWTFAPSNGYATDGIPWASQHSRR